jgi:hypothetical protein
MRSWKKGNSKGSREIKERNREMKKSERGKGTEFKLRKGR